MRPSGSASTSAGLTTSERYLSSLCKRTFLSLWAYPNVYRDKGSELCDLLVVFENHILIFSDKECAFGDSGDIDRDWSGGIEKRSGNLQTSSGALNGGLNNIRIACSWIPGAHSRFRCAAKP